MITLESYVCGRWVSSNERPSVLVNPSTEEPLAQTSTAGIDFAAAYAYAIDKGGPALRALTFAKRGEILRALSKAIHSKRDELIELAMSNGGNTRSDAKFDIDGASGTLAAYADLGASLGDTKLLTDGDFIPLGRSSRVGGQHVCLPRNGVAVHINAFNFPAWGLAEKAATALLAGMPVLSKPATATALLSYRIAQLLVETGTLPDGAMQFIAGSTGNLLDLLGPQDVLAFTGSGATGTKFRLRENIARNSVRVNVEADSLNAAILAPDAERGSDTYQLFLADVLRDMTQKTGQKCTAIRRVLVPAALLEAVQEDLLERLALVKTGNPTHENVTMGPLSSLDQLHDVRKGIAQFIEAGATVLTGGPSAMQGLGAPEGKGYFVAPTLLAAKDVHGVSIAHEHEVFGPVATLFPYDKPEEAVSAVRKGNGGLVSTVYVDDRSLAETLVMGIAAFHGRVGIVNGKLSGAGMWLGPGTVLPQLVHGGPGRAGGGEELGGTRGMGLYLQRTALQGFGPLLEHLTAGAKRL